MRNKQIIDWKGRSLQKGREGYDTRNHNRNCFRASDLLLDSSNSVMATGGDIEGKIDSLDNLGAGAENCVLLTTI